jgi:hypothetical protein
MPATRFIRAEGGPGAAGAFVRHRHAILFYSLLLTLGAAPVVSALGGSNTFLQVFLGFNLLGAALSVGRYQWALVVFALASIGVRLLAARLGSPFLDGGSLLLWTVLALLAAVASLRYAFGTKRVDTEHLYAALIPYLLVGIFCGVLHWTIENASPASFASGGAAMGPGEFTLSRGIYFSFVTLATLGYGDIVPNSDLTRGLAVIEAVAGQLYVAVIVARLVGAYAQRAD